LVYLKLKLYTDLSGCLVEWFVCHSWLKDVSHYYEPHQSLPVFLWARHFTLIA